MITKLHSAAVYGIEASLVEVEVDVSPGMPSYATVGLPDAAVKESQNRVLSAVKNSGFEEPVKKIVVNLAPADIRKEGTAFDLPIALCLLAAQDAVAQDKFHRHAVLGELSLDGRVKRIRGALSVAAMIKRLGTASGIDTLIVPRESAAEAAVVEGIKVIPVENLPEAVEYFSGRRDIKPVSLDLGKVFTHASQRSYEDDFRDVKGQHHVKRGMEVAAAGGHNILLIGPPGAGKSMLAKRIPSILPPLSLDESIETTKIHSVTGLAGSGEPIITARPFRSPHHTISDVALIGGGTIPMPGEVSLAHNGVLFLDELPEFKRNALEVLRQPMEEATVTISRAAMSVTFPAGFMLAAAMNPCPCGYYNDTKRECNCNPGMIKSYLGRISGPLMDRIDIHIEVRSLEYRELAAEDHPAVYGESSAEIAARVKSAREIQSARFNGSGIYVNARMNSKLLKEHCRLKSSEAKLLEQATNRLGLSARGYDKILKVARTISDLDSSAGIAGEHIAEAVQYRSLDRTSYGVPSR